MTNEKIDEIVVKFNRYCSVAEERYDEPKYVFAALLTMLDLLEGKEHRANEEKKEPMEAIPSAVTLLGVVPKSEFEKTILKDLVNLGCESLEDIKWIRAIVDKDGFDKKYYVMVKSRLARLPGYWSGAAVAVLSSMMRKKNLTLAVQV